ncbi:molybdopterin molybdotransferase MoeA [Erysipelotrichaceae bacterium OttesenSCG-928-M19]|nr:molybdopterin molybdotransferase MoeA [Erysipelotrichaceae bacterium OttesenSCG-928-M19]
MKLLKVLSVSELKEHLIDYLRSKQSIIELDLINSLDYVLAEDVYALEDIPNFYKSTVDGYALKAKDTQLASESIPSILKCRESVKIGSINTIELGERECSYINTGAMLPYNSNAVLMIEDSDYVEATNEVLVFKSLAENENVSIPGVDITQDMLLFKQYQLIDSRVLATLASQGIKKVKVFKKMSCAIISSGNELVPYQSEIMQAQVRDINTILLDKTLIKYGFEIKQTKLIKDDFDLYYQSLKEIDVDIYLTSGGSSQGNEDYTYDVFDKLTSNVFCHGLAIKPGKPTVVARNDNKLYLGLPGNPVSAYLVLRQTLIEAYLELYHIKKTIILAHLAHNTNSSPGKDSLILVKFVFEDNKVIAKPLYYRSSNVYVLAQADGYFVITSNSEGKNKDDIVEVIVF